MNGTQNIVIRLTNVSKRYTIHHEKPTLAERLVNGKDEEFWALKNINLTIRKGERVGIIGPNGSGKTTLLKIIAGITTPTSGIVETHGKIVSLIDLEAGFHPELTGEQNIYLNGMLLGINKKELDRRLTSIIRYANINQFIDAPLFTYSSGMKLRLGFSIAIHADPDILILDEGISVGDKFFQKKSTATMQKLIKSGITLFMVSHQIITMKQICQRYVMFSDNRIIADGSKKILNLY